MDCKDTLKPTRRAGTSGAKRDSADVCLRRGARQGDRESRERHGLPWRTEVRRVSRHRPRTKSGLRRRRRRDEPQEATHYRHQAAVAHLAHGLSDPNVSDKEARSAANCMVLHPACHDHLVEFYNLTGFIRTISEGSRDAESGKSRRKRQRALRAREDAERPLLHVLAAVDRDIGAGHEGRLVRA
jgi:hypothetical protein